MSKGPSCFGTTAYLEPRMVPGAARYPGAQPPEYDPASATAVASFKEESSVQISPTMQIKLLEKIDQSLSDFEDISTDSYLLESHLTREVNITESEFQKLARASMFQMEERVISPYRTELNRMKNTIVASNHELKRRYINDINLLLDNVISAFLSK